MNRIEHHGPAVSVLVPSFRAGHYLVRLCESLVAQSFQDFEVLILIDGGDDHLHPGMHAFMADPRFRIEAGKTNRGVAAATAHLLAQVRGAYWCYPGADDLLHPEFLACRMEIAARVPEANVIFGPGIQIDAAGVEIWYHPLRVMAERLSSFDGRRIETRLMLRLLLQENVINTPSVFCRSEATVPILLNANVDWRYAQDYNYWILLAAAGAGFCYDARMLHSYRMHQDQMSRDPALESLRLAEFRLVPLVALAAAARLSVVGAECWDEWRDDLYALWIARAGSLLRRGKLRWKWQRRAASAYHGRPMGAVGALVDFLCMMPRSVALHRDESRRAVGQIWVNGLRKIDEPIFQVRT